MVAILLLSLNPPQWKNAAQWMSKADVFLLHMTVAHTAKTSPAFLQLVSHCGERARMYYMNVCLVPRCIVPVCVPAGLGSAGRGRRGVWWEKAPHRFFFSKSKWRVQRGRPLHGSMGPLRFVVDCPSWVTHSKSNVPIYIMNGRERRKKQFYSLLHGCFSHHASH